MRKRPILLGGADRRLDNRGAGGNPLRLLIVALALALQGDRPPNWIVWNTYRWLPYVERQNGEFHLDEALVLSVIAQESQGFEVPPPEIGYDGNPSVGLMQVIPRPAMPREMLEEPDKNIYWGMNLLANAIWMANGDWRTGLAIYNCGWQKLWVNDCGNGGYGYADRVLGHWYPIFWRWLGGDNERADRKAS